MIDHQRSATALFLAGILFVATHLGPPAHALSAAECSVNGEINLSPGITMMPSHGTFYGTATLDCQGVAYGHTLDGPGFISYRGTYGSGSLSDPQKGETCLAGSGRATYESQVETTDGRSLRDTGSFEGNAVGAINLDIARSHRGAFSFGVIESRSDTGDCLHSPVTHANISGQAIYGGPP